MDWKDRMQEIVESHRAYQASTFAAAGVHTALARDLCKWYIEIASHFYSHAVEDIQQGRVEVGLGPTWKKEYIDETWVDKMDIGQ